MPELIVYCLLAALLGFIIAWLVKPSPAAGVNQAEHHALLLQMASRDTSLTHLQAELDLRLQELGELRSSINGSTEENRRLELANNHLNAQLRFLEEKLQTQRNDSEDRLRLGQAQMEERLNSQRRDFEEKLQHQRKELDEIGSRFTREFQLLAQQVLDEKGKRFEVQQEKSLSEILNPLKENLQNFRNEFETKFKYESDERIGLKEQIRHMMDLNQTLSTQANNLTNALRGQVKQQGNWGEMILESILEYADLQKNIHYFPQEQVTGEDGQSLYPDIIVRYPGNRSIIIDSKVSLLHYEQYCSATDAVAQKAAMSQLIDSVYRHLDGLSSKRYQELTGSLDFVLMFIPVEGAYISIMQADRELWQSAYKKRVLLMSPTNLIAAMKLVYDLWKKEGINQNAQQVAERAVKIYEKLAAFVEDFEKVGAQLEKASSTWREAQKKLVTGKGNVIGQAARMQQKISHNKPVRNLPKDLEEQGLLEDGDDE